MATEDVIELGSSDEDTAPAPKRVKTMPNAMVHIPSKLPGLSIKPTKTCPKNANPINKLIGKSVTVTKLNSSQIPIVQSSEVTIKPVKTSKRPPRAPNYLQKPITIPSSVHISSVMNPLNVMRKLNNSQVQVNRVPKPAVTPMKSSIRVSNVKSLSSVPPQVSIKKVPVISNVSSLKANSKKQKRSTPKRKVVETVELDDEESPAPTPVGPAWYLRPEEINTSLEQEPSLSTEQEPSVSMEQQNNAEPAPTKMIEITIEDSPLKPLNKRTHEVGAELAITIDDSPVKAAAKPTEPLGSDDETPNNDKEPQSKKKLDYLKEIDTPIGTTIEIEFEPIDPPVEAKADNERAEKIVEVPITEDIVEIIESPAKKAQPNPVTPKKVQKEQTKPSEVPQTSQSGEFHAVYQEFIDLCLKLENSNDMKTIIEKKIKAYYRQVPKEYSSSDEFIDMVQSKILAMKADPEKLYLYIKDIVDELNLQRKMAKAHPVVKEPSVVEAENFQYGEESEFDIKRQRQIRKLEKTLRKLHRAIQKLEEQEVDFDDEEDSVYLLTERYKERMIRVHTKFCQLTNTKMPSEPRIVIEPRPGQPAGPAKRLEKWVNKKVPIGKPLPFPDFHDVLRCVREANDENKLGWNEADIMEEARDLFTRCGKKLQRRRQENEWRLAVSRLSLDVDPAEDSEDLKKKLDNNRQLGHKREADVVNKFADKQSQLKLEAVEIGDKEAEESPVESEDDDVVEEGATLGNKEKRKERLRRLIHEKSRKSVEDKENEPKGESKSQSDVTPQIETVESSVNEKQETDKDNEYKKPEDEKLEDKKESEEGQAPEAAKEGKEGTTEIQEGIHSISDDSEVGSDVDELHLLQKLHSEVNTSTIESSDSDSPIDISDTIQSSSEKEKQNSDVISIENSSYSESENKEEEKENTNMDVEMTETVEGNKNDALKRSECSTSTSNSKGTSEQIEQTESIPSSGEENNASEIVCSKNNECVNLIEDSMSMGETVLQSVDNNAEFITGALDSPRLKENDKNTSKSAEESKVPKESEVQNDKEAAEDGNKKIGCIEDVTIAKKDEEHDTDKSKDVLSSTEDKNGDIQNQRLQNGVERSLNVEDVDMIETNNSKEHNSSEKEERMDTDQNAHVEESLDTEGIINKNSEITKNDVQLKDNGDFETLDSMLEDLRSDLGMSDSVLATVSNSDVV